MRRLLRRKEKLSKSIFPCMDEESPSVHVHMERLALSASAFTFTNNIEFESSSMLI
jgi:hypothetical protein